MRYDLVFIILALVCLVARVTIGLWFFGPGGLSLLPTRVHVNLLGWSTLALYGLIHRAYPEMARTRLAVVHLALAATGAIVMPLGFALPMETGHLQALAIGGVSAALAPIAFIIMFVGKVVLVKATV